MAVYIQCATDAFAMTRKQAKEEGAGYENVRRPLRGIQVKPNTYAIIRAKKANGDDIYLFDSSTTDIRPEAEGGIGKGRCYANFLIQRLTEQRAEKQQIIETFGEDYVYFFGERPRFLDVQGVLVNTADFQWKNEFWTNYEQFLRGTRLVEQNARLYLYIGDTVIEGYIVNAGTNDDASQPNMCPFQFQLFITNYQIVSPVGSVFIPQSDTGGPEIKAISIDPMTSEELAGQPIGTGGFNTFLAQTSSLATRAEVAIQGALEKVRNTLYGTQMSVPSGIGTMANDVKMFPPLTNQMAMVPAPINRPIHEMIDEYVVHAPLPLTGDALMAQQAEEKRLAAALAFRSPQQLEAAARAAFEEAGIDTGEPSAMATILGRGAFAAAQYLAPFGIARLNPKAKQAVEGTLELL